MKKQITNFLELLGGWFLWLAPLAIFTLALIVPSYLFNLDFLKFIEILAWPFTVLTALFFFKKVFTFLFFSMDEFNFFGLKGHLKNVNEVILDEVNKRVLEKEKENSRKEEREKLNNEIKEKENQINEVMGSADEYKKIAKEILKDWKDSTKQHAKTVLDLEKENKHLKEILSSFPAPVIEVDPAFSSDEISTSDEIVDESSNT